MINPRMKPLIQALVRLLIEGHFEELATRGANGRLSIEDIKHALDAYPGKVTMPPNAAFDGSMFTKSTAERLAKTVYEIPLQNFLDCHIDIFL